MNRASWICVAVVLRLMFGVVVAAEPVEHRTVVLKDVRATVSKPVLVAESHDYLWFPTLIRRGNELMAVMNDQSDEYHAVSTAKVCWSSDGGQHWTKPVAARWGDGAFVDPSGTLGLLPFALHTNESAYSADAISVPVGSRELRVEPGALIVDGFPDRILVLDGQNASASLRFNGDSINLTGGDYLTTAYGQFASDRARRTMVLESADGRHWKYRATVSTIDGPNESALCRLKDGRLLCVFRRSAYTNFAQAWSDDEGRNWTPPRVMQQGHSVQPSLAVLRDGTTLLSAGRPGVYLWIDLAGRGEDWQALCLHEHHNAYFADFQIPVIEKQISSRDLRTSSYTQVVPLDDRRVLVVYDYLPAGWGRIPPESSARNQVWCLEIALDRVQP